MSPSIVIPAHNEGKVVGRLLDGLASGGLAPGTDVVVVCNGCSDDTVAQAGQHGAILGARVVDIPLASKTAALNEGDRLAQGFPRMYLDADVVVSPSAVNAVFEALASGSALAGRPSFRYETAGSEPIVRAYYRARERTPELMAALWGAGCFAVSEAGRARWREFPVGVADDFFVNSLFASHEKVVVSTEPLTVSPPRTAAALLRTLHRVHSPGKEPEAALDRASTSRTLRAVLRANRRSPRHIIDAAGYVAVSVSARLPTRRQRGDGGWQRDETTR